MRLIHNVYRDAEFGRDDTDAFVCLEVICCCNYQNSAAYICFFEVSFSNFAVMRDT